MATPWRYIGTEPDSILIHVGQAREGERFAVTSRLEEQRWNGGTDWGQFTALVFPPRRATPVSRKGMFWLCFHMTGNLRSCGEIQQ